MKADLQAIKNLGEHHTLPLEEDVTLLNMHLSQFFETFLEIHLLRIKNGTAEDFPSGDFTIQGSPIFNLNCDPEVADKDFLAAIEKSDNRTQEAFQKCHPGNGTLSKSWLQYVANLEWQDTQSHVIFTLLKTERDEIIAQKDDFDLKNNALGKWEEQLTGQVTYWHTHIIF